MDSQVSPLAQSLAAICVASATILFLYACQAALRGISLALRVAELGLRAGLVLLCAVAALSALGFAAPDFGAALAWSRAAIDSAAGAGSRLWSAPDRRIDGVVDAALCLASMATRVWVNRTACDAWLPPAAPGTHTTDRQDEL